MRGESRVQSPESRVENGTNATHETNGGRLQFVVTVGSDLALFEARLEHLESWLRAKKKGASSAGSSVEQTASYWLEALAAAELRGSKAEGVESENPE